MNKKKYIYLTVTLIILLLIATGISYAWFSVILKGNDTVKTNTLSTANLELTFTDTSEITLDNSIPGVSFDKVISIKNTGTLNTGYSIVWQELVNQITNNELVIEATCKRLNASGTEEGTCEGINQTAINSLILNSVPLIEPNITHEYSIKVTFIDTGSPQNYNKNKNFSGKLGIEEYQQTAFRKDSWSTIVANVKSGNISNYNLGDTKEIDLGNYGIYKVRIANTSTPSECSTEGFSQTACGFVLEFAGIMSNHQMNSINTNKGGWPASSLYQYLNIDLYNSLSTELKNMIIDTTVVSGHGSDDTDNFVSTDKFYLLSAKEIYKDYIDESDSVNNFTRQLDYYKQEGVSTSNYSKAIKKYGSTALRWWLRSANSANNNCYNFIYDIGSCNNNNYANINYGISPAFRIG